MRHIPRSSKRLLLAGFAVLLAAAAWAGKVAYFAFHGETSTAAESGPTTAAAAAGIESVYIDAPESDDDHPANPEPGGAEPEHPAEPDAAETPADSEGGGGPEAEVATADGSVAALGALALGGESGPLASAEPLPDSFASAASAGEAGAVEVHRPERAGPQVADFGHGAGAAVPRLGQRRVEVQFALESRGAAEVIEYQLYTTADGGQSWRADGAPYRGSSPMVFEAPRDGRYGFFVTARDRLGAGDLPPRPGQAPQSEAVIDTTPPKLEILRPRQERQLLTSLPVEIEWQVEDDNLGAEPAELAYSLDDGPWAPIWSHAPAAATRQWTPPFTRGALRLRLRAWDLAGNVAERVSEEPMQLFHQEGAAQRILIAPAVARRRSVPLYYRLQEGDSGPPLGPERLREVRLWQRRHSAEPWRDGGADLDRNSPAELRVPDDGLYQIFLTAEDDSGRLHPAGSASAIGSAPPPELSPLGTVLVDTHEPRLRLIEPLDGSELAAGGRLRIQYEIQEENPLRDPPLLQFSLDGGASWSELPMASEVAARRGAPHRYGGAHELRLPFATSEGFLLAVTQLDIAGNRGRVMTDPARPLRLRTLPQAPQILAQSLCRKALLALSQPDPQRKAEALGLFESALASWEGDATLHHDYAVALEQTGRAASEPLEALTHYRRAVELEPESAALRVGLVRFLLSLSRRPDQVGDAAVWRREALQEFGRIQASALRLPEHASADDPRLDECRRLYERWKSEEFAAESP